MDLIRTVNQFWSPLFIFFLAMVGQIDSGQFNSPCHRTIMYVDIVMAIGDCIILEKMKHGRL